jgi:hypothetical protein
MAEKLEASTTGAVLRTKLSEMESFGKEELCDGASDACSDGKERLRDACEGSEAISCVVGIKR